MRESSIPPHLAPSHANLNRTGTGTLDVLGPLVYLLTRTRYRKAGTWYRYLQPAPAPPFIARPAVYCHRYTEAEVPVPGRGRQSPLVE